MWFLVGFEIQSALKTRVWWEEIYHTYFSPFFSFSESELSFYPPYCKS